ncbi:MAG TPA: hypothetical protein PLP95_06955 [Microthrixaceae bacterium]|nr:hypothetical protein [Microthrixaceae bacterium]
MSAKRFALGSVALICLLLAGWLATTDVHVDNATCGTALLRRDPLASLVVTGDIVEDALTEDWLTSICGRNITRQRILTAIPLAVGVAAIITGSRERALDEAVNAR